MISFENICLIEIMVQIQLKKYCFVLPKVVRQEIVGEVGTFLYFAGVQFLQDVNTPRLFKTLTARGRLTRPFSG